MQKLKQSTAFTTIVGPILDADGVEYASAVIGDLSITKNGTTAAMASSATLTYIANGYYTLVGTTGNSDTAGRVDIHCNKSTYQMPPRSFEVLPGTTFDAMITNAAGAAGGLVYNGSNTGTVIPTVTTVGTCTTNSDMRGTDSAATAANLATVAGYLDTEIAAILADTNELQTNQGNWLTATGFSTLDAADVWTSGTRTLTSGAAPSAATIADAVCDELLADHVIAGSVAAGISSAQAAGDLLSIAVPGAYAAGTAGFALGEVASFNPFVINSSTTNIADRIQATTITLYYGENGYTIGPVEVLNDGVAVDLTTFTSLRFTIEDKYKTDLLVVTNVTISGVSSNYWQVTGTSAATLAAPASHQWSLRGIGTNINVVLGHGTVNLVYVPDQDA